MTVIWGNAFAGIDFKTKVYAIQSETILFCDVFLRDDNGLFFFLARQESKKNCVCTVQRHRELFQHNYYLFQYFVKQTKLSIRVFLPAV